MTVTHQARSFDPRGTTLSAVQCQLAVTVAGGTACRTVGPRRGDYRTSVFFEILFTYFDAVYSRYDNTVTDSQHRLGRAEVSFIDPSG